MKKKAFIGYSNEERNIVHEIKIALTLTGWIEPIIVEFPEQDEIGKQLREKIANRIEESHFMITLYTRNAQRAEWPNQEIGYAYALTRDITRIVPIVEERNTLKGIITSDLDLPLIINLEEPNVMIENLIKYLNDNRPRFEKYSVMGQKEGLSERQQQIKNEIIDKIKGCESLLVLEMTLNSNLNTEYIPQLVDWITRKIVYLEANLPKDNKQWKLINADNPQVPPDCYFRITKPMHAGGERFPLGSIRYWIKNAMQFQQTKDVILHIIFMTMK